MEAIEKQLQLFRAKFLIVSHTAQEKGECIKMRAYRLDKQAFSELMQVFEKHKEKDRITNLPYCVFQIEGNIAVAFRSLGIMHFYVNSQILQIIVK
jgi:hypothetical protein